MNKVACEKKFLLKYSDAPLFYGHGCVANSISDFVAKIADGNKDIEFLVLDGEWDKYNPEIIYTDELNALMEQYLNETKQYTYSQEVKTKVFVTVRATNEKIALEKLNNLEISDCYYENALLIHY